MFLWTNAFSLLVLILLWTLAENTIDYVREDDIFINHGLKNVTAVSAIRCCIVCTTDENCVSVSFNGAEKVCQLNDKSPYNSGNVTKTRIIGWTSFYDKHQCRYGWHNYCGSCYKVMEVYGDWASSETHCQEVGGHLVDIQNNDEQQFVRTMAFNVSEHGSFWIGLNDNDEKGTLVWSSTAPNHFQSNMDMDDPGNCVFLYAFYDVWVIGDCFNYYHSICKVDN